MKGEGMPIYNNNEPLQNLLFEEKKNKWERLKKKEGNINLFKIRKFLNIFQNPKLANAEQSRTPRRLTCTESTIKFSEDPNVTNNMQSFAGNSFEFALTCLE